MLSPDQIKQAAADLLEAEATSTQMGLLSLRHPEMTIDDAYAVQKELINAKLAQGRRIIGWKIGLTSRAMQDALKIDTPDSGILFDDMLFENGGTIPKGRFVQPRVEAEIAFVMKADLPNGNVTHADVIAATDYVAPSLEILDTRILRADPKTGKPRVIVDTISDNAANAGIVLGDKQHAIGAHELRWVGAIVTRNDIVEETGLGAGVQNDPVTGIVWLANRMAAYDQHIRAGDVVLSGSFIRPLEAPSGSHIHADYGPFGSVTCTFG